MKFSRDHMATTANEGAKINHKLSLLYSRNHFIQEPRINTKRKRFVNLILPDISESWAIVEKKKMIACVLFSLP